MTIWCYAEKCRHFRATAMDRQLCLELGNVAGFFSINSGIPQHKIPA